MTHESSRAMPCVGGLNDGWVVRGVVGDEMWITEHEISSKAWEVNPIEHRYVRDGDVWRWDGQP